MKKSIKTALLSVVAKVGMKSAKIGANSVSMFGFYQPKEPREMQELKKK